MSVFHFRLLFTSMKRIALKYGGVDLSATSYSDVTKGLPPPQKPERKNHGLWRVGYNGSPVRVRGAPAGMNLGHCRFQLAHSSEPRGFHGSGAGSPACHTTLTTVGQRE